MLHHVTSRFAPARKPHNSDRNRGAASAGLRVPGGLGALALGLLMTACAGTTGRTGQTTPANVSEPRLESVRGSLTSLEDSLVLDLVLGYRARTEGGGDAETLRRARAAQTQLEYMLRHGGVKSRGGDARVITVDGDRLTLEETVNQLSAALMRYTPGTPWRPEAERAREIQRRRPELSALVEDAEWVLALAAALDGPLPADTKNHLRLLHESYAARAPHAEVARQVNALMPSVPEESLRREIKKLANRSWDRERRGGNAGFVKPAAATQPPPATSVTPPPPATPATPALPVPAPASPPAARSPVPDSLSSAAATDGTDGDAVTPERFCAERRADAAVAFAQARASADSAARAQRLQHSLDLLDACISRYPDSPEAEKARQNRDRVRQEMLP